MTEQPAPIDQGARITALEQELAAVRSQSTDRLVQAELKVEAVRLGILDLDCLKLVDRAALTLNDDGSVPEAATALARLKREKPWMFSRPNSSHPAPPPAPEPPQQKTAKAMSHAEWRAARDELIRRA